MGRGFISGILWGAVLAVAGLVALSLVVREAPDMADGAPVAPVAGPQDPVAAPVPADGAPATEAATVPGEDAVASPDSPAPAAPAPDAEATPDVSPDAAASPPESPVTRVDPVPAPDTGSAPAPVAGVDTPAPSAGVGQAPEAAAAETLPGEVTEPVLPAADAAGGTPGDAPPEGRVVVLESPADPSVPAAPPAPAGAPAAGETAPVTGSAPAAPGPAPIKSAPVARIGDQAPNVTTNRLPRIGVAPDPSPQDAPADALAVLETALPERAIMRNAAPFENPEARPLIAVLLQDTGAARSGLGDLKALPFAASFAVDASAPDAAEAIAFYRDAGAEVVLLVPLPQGATPTDVEVTLQVHGALLADSVALMVGGGAGFQAAGDAARQVAEVLAASGHGLVSFPQGLNTGHKSAVKAGVPAGLIFRQLDNDGQSGAVIRRFMDNAAFRARQEKGVILLGQARTETVQALIEWSLGNRASSVALAPVSAVLRDR